MNRGISEITLLCLLGAVGACSGGGDSALHTADSGITAPEGSLDDSGGGPSSDASGTPISNDAGVRDGSGETAIDSGYDAEFDGGGNTGGPPSGDGGSDAPPADASYEAGDDAGFDAGLDASSPPTSPCILDGGVYVANGTPCVGVGSNPECWNGACVTAMESCASGGPGMTNCGASGTDDCCASLGVDGGSFDRTFTNDGTGPEDGGDPASVSDYRLDKYLVTVGRFRQFVAAWDAGWLPPAASGRHSHLYGGQGLIVGGDGGAEYEPGWESSDDYLIAPTDVNLVCGGTFYSTWTSTASVQENLPINCVTWPEAYAFCIWDGAFLPSENETEYASYGGAGELEYPWGSAGGASPSDECAIYSTNYLTVTGGVHYIAPVGMAPLGAGAWGQLDLVGNLFEWEQDWFDNYVSPCTDCTNIGLGVDRALRGGYFYSEASGLLSSDRSYDSPQDREYWSGFRCARTP